MATTRRITEWLKITAVIRRMSISRMRNSWSTLLGVKMRER